MSEPFFSHMHSNTRTSFPDNGAPPLPGTRQVEHTAAAQPAQPVLASRDTTSAASIQLIAMRGEMQGQGIAASTCSVVTGKKTASETELESSNAERARFDDKEAYPEVLRLKELIVDGRLELNCPVSRETLQAPTVLLQNPQCEVPDLSILGEPIGSMDFDTTAVLGPDRAASLSDALKANGILASIDFEYNSIGDGGSGCADGSGEGQSQPADAWSPT